MISNKAIEDIFLKMEDILHVQIEGDGYHYHLTIVSNVFANKSKVARQQWVYAQLKDYITAGSLHALSMKTLTQEEWEKEQHG